MYVSFVAHTIFLLNSFAAEELEEAEGVGTRSEMKGKCFKKNQKCKERGVGQPYLAEQGRADIRVKRETENRV